MIAAKKISRKSKIKDIELIELFQNVLALNNNSRELEKFVMSIASKKGTTAGVNYLKSQNINKMISLLWIELINVLRK